MANPQSDRFSPGLAVAEPTHDMVAQVGETIKDAAAGVAKKAGEAASYIGRKADDATTVVGKDMKSLAGTIREGGPQEGMLGSANSTVASTLESSGKYLEEHGLSGIAEDITETIRRHPIPAVLIGVGIGYLLYRTLRS